MGTKHYHYLMPLVLLALNIARIDLIFKRSAFKFEAKFAGVMFVLYLLGACTLYFKRDELLDTSFYTGFFAVIFSSLLCFYAFCAGVFSARYFSFCFNLCVSNGSIFDYFCIISKRYYLEY